MKTTAISIIMCLSVTNMSAQALKQQGVSAESITPQGWEHHEAIGDLNHDGIKDLVLLAKPNFKDMMMTRDDGYEYNFNPYILAIYFGQSNGIYRQWRQYDTLFEGDTEWHTVEVDVEVTERSALNISLNSFSSAGSYGNNLDKYTYRFQNGDFYMIGKETTEMQRNTGEMTTVSENYLTWKRQTIKDNAFEDVVKKETWSKLTKKPLEKLGARTL